MDNSQKQKAFAKYQQEKLYFKIFHGYCWNTDCNGTLTKIENGKVYIENGQEYVRVAICKKCGKTYSYWTFKQWVKNKKSSARRAIKDTKEKKADVKAKYKGIVTKAKHEREESLKQIKNKVNSTRNTLKKLRGI